MKTKYVTLMSLLLVVSTTLFAQLKVDNQGHIGMGTNWPNPGYRCHVKGNLLLTTHPAYPFVEFKFKVGNGWPGAEIGSTVDQIAFWSTWTSYNKLYAEKYYKMSDSTMKQNIQPLTGGISKILKLTPYTYEIQDNRISPETGEKIKGFSKEYGFLSQEVKEIFPEVAITDKVKGVLLMDYSQIIPLTVLAIKEQQGVIDSLKRELQELKRMVIMNQNQDDTIQTTNISGEIITASLATLYQNQPNPFTEKTIIKYDISPENLVVSQKVCK